MKILASLLLLGVGTPALSFVIPDTEDVQQIFGSQSSRNSPRPPLLEKLQDAPFEALPESGPNQDLEFWDTGAWLGHEENIDGSLFESASKKHDHERHHRGRHHSDPDPFDRVDGGPPCHCGPHNPPPLRKPHMPPKDHTGPHRDSTMWDLISKSRHARRFYELVKDDQDVVNILSDEKHNHTVFVPSNRAFKLLDRLKHHSLPKKLVHQVLLYHIAPGVHPSQDLRYHNTLMTSLPDDDLGKDMHQRLRVGLNRDGLWLNFYSQFTMLDIHANNGVIHAVDAILFPPPSVLDLVRSLPTEFSTTEAALHRTGLIDELPKLRGKGLTIFAPSNRDWQKLGVRINAFLFSPCGNAHLRALIKYHVAPNHNLYSDALESPGAARGENELDDPSGLHHGYSHVDLPTLLKGKHLSVDITRLERFLSFRVNGLTSVVISDGIAKSGVIQVPDHVLIPPHSLKDHMNPPTEQEEGGRDGPYTLEEFKQILEPFVEREELELGLRRQRVPEL